MRIGLTGGIASGKSTVSRLLLQRGYPIVDADVIAREVVLPGQDTYHAIIKEFGSSILHEDQTINRKKLGSIIFGNEIKRQKLNEIIHPAIRQAMKTKASEFEKKGHAIVIMDIPLLLESKLTYMVEKILLVYVRKELQLVRLMDRDNFSKEEALQRIESQMSIEEKRKYADYIIDNQGSIEETERQLDEITVKWVND
ncbi:dephospho-CoA kinase [Evansella sp. AB-rgal1]|uniref:dephospho-CoA kinase n=1 Tax=Evansella sp. AB-rgal1 TaxID=3242696 RepID=UPI00359EF58F